MKRYILSSFVAVSALLSLTSCEDMMSPQSSSYLYNENLTLSSAKDSLYSTAGLLAKVQRLGERYVTFGELRGDMMYAAPTADLELQELATFSAQSRETLLRRSDFYAVINHCNWMISKFDDAVKNGEQEALVEEYGAAVLYRAWTYLQMGLAYGNVNWVTEPVLTLEDSEKDYPVVGLDELVKRLIAEVEPFANAKRPNLGMLDNKVSSNFFQIPSAFLADLYLYDGQYERAAEMYWNAIQEYEATIHESANTFSSSLRLGVNNSFAGTWVSEELVTIPYSSNAKDYHPNLVNMTFSDAPALLPAAWWLDDMSSNDYYFGSKNYVASTFSRVEEGGDLRGVVRLADGRYASGGAVSQVRPDGSAAPELMIYKYRYCGSVFQGATTENTVTNEAVGVTELSLLRAPHLYLRYAEAVNRMGKPSLAYAVVRYGLNKETLEDPLKVNPDELADEMPWENWNASFANNNIGTRMRGRGLGISYPEAVAEDLPTDLTEDELMLYVEDILADEMAAETAYEGNRFFDLARIAHHRGDNSWFADRVSRRFADSASAHALLMNRDNWFIH